MLLYAELLLTERCKEGSRTGTLFVAWHTEKSSSYLASYHAMKTLSVLWGVAA